MRKEEGFTMIEVLISFLVFGIILSSTLSFFQSIETRHSELGEYDTAKHLLINAIEEEREKVLLGNEDTGDVYSNQVSVNSINFHVKINKEQLDYNFYSAKIPLYKLKAVVTWKKKSLEVNTIVSAR